MDITRENIMMIKFLAFFIFLITYCGTSLAVPANAIPYGDGWLCKDGYKRNGNSCVLMSKQEKIDQLKKIDKLKEIVRRSYAIDNCSTLSDYASYAERYARRAQNASDFDECSDYARKAKNYASDAYSQTCKCSEAQSAASDAETYARRAQNASDFDECSDYARKAKNYASDAYSYANSCY